MTASSNSSKNSPYHRFIPREEVQVVSPWEFQSMDGKPPKGSTAAAPAPEPPPELPPPDLDLIKQQAFDEGFEQGRVAGAKATRDALDAPLRRTAEDVARRLSLLLQNTEAELLQAEDHLSEQLLEMACDVARQVVRRELTQPLQAVRAVVEEALAATVRDELTRTLRLNPTDFALLQNHIDGMIDSDRVKLVADDRITAGGCVLQTATGTVDGTLEKRWMRAVANLGLKSRWEADTVVAAETALAEAADPAEPNTPEPDHA